jgi:transcriptional regulator with PAS, ATPase and Fis domain
MTVQNVYSLLFPLEAPLERDKEDPMKAIEEVLAGYGMTPLIAWAIRFFLRNPYESLVIVDRDGRFEFMDNGSEKFFGFSTGRAKGLLATDLIETSSLPAVLENQTPLIGKVFNVNGQRRIGSAYPLVRDGKLVGAMGRLIFRSLDEVDRISEEVNRLRRTVTSLRQRELQQHRALYTFENILGQSTNIRECAELARKAAITGADVLIIGESGTGKELFAQAIHNYNRPDMPFVGVNTPAIPFDLAESELFGYKKGAFSGASAVGKPGKFEMANNGTLFLDEIATVPLSIQAKLLRALEEREIQALGDVNVKKVRFQLISATNMELRDLAECGKFRSDLYYRIAKITIRIDPLRKRREDIPVLVTHILNSVNRRFGTSFRSVTPQALGALANHGWPGNVRELTNVLEQACLKKWRGEEVTLDCLPPEIARMGHKRVEKPLGSFKETKQATERRLILEALEKTNGNRVRAASLLDMPRSTLYKKIKEYRLDGGGRRQTD